MNRLVLNLIAVLALSFGIASCSTTNELRGSSVAPAASGVVKTNTSKNGNTQVNLTVKHLAPPERVLAGASHYVIWATPTGGATQNIGSLVVNNDFEGVYKTSLPYERFLLTVTAETDRLTSDPNGPEIFRKHIE